MGKTRDIKIKVFWWFMFGAGSYCVIWMLYSFLRPHAGMLGNGVMSFVLWSGLAVLAVMVYQVGLLKQHQEWVKIVLAVSDNSSDIQHFQEQIRQYPLINRLMLVRLAVKKNKWDMVDWLLDSIFNPKELEKGVPAVLALDPEEQKAFETYYIRRGECQQLLSSTKSLHLADTGKNRRL